MQIRKVRSMEIGPKIKHARGKANLTQEEAAEALGVSRQTVSNWENGKTYPDIASVVKMSDLYSISLDQLLKEEQPVSNYLNYLEESTNTVKSNQNLSRMIMVLFYLGTWILCVLTFWLLTGPADGFGYGLLAFYVVLPIATFLSSFFIGKNNFWGKWKWICPLVFGIMNMLAGYVTFKLANMVTVHVFRMPDFGDILPEAVVSLLGIGIGIAVKRLNTPRERT